MTDLATIKTAERTFEILHPGSGDKLGVRCTIVHVDDERLMKVKRHITDRRLYLEARGKQFKSEEIEENKQNLLFAATTDWEWYNPTGAEGDKEFDANAMPSFNGEIPDFTRKNFNNVITALPWFGDQINAEVGETKAFFDNSKPN